MLCGPPRQRKYGLTSARTTMRVERRLKERFDALARPIDLALVLRCCRDMQGDCDIASAIVKSLMCLGVYESCCWRVFVGGCIE